jgi:hypothetical protein
MKVNKKWITIHIIDGAVMMVLESLLAFVDEVK